MKRRTFLLQTAATGAILAGPRNATTDPSREWRFYGGDAGCSRYSPCDQIKPSNAAKLKVAWTHATGDANERPATTIECTPIVADGVMYVTTPRVRLQALDAATGELKWTFDPLQGETSRRSPGVNRGVSYWEEGDDKRIFLTYQDRLWAVDARTGKAVESFGSKGVIDLKQHFDHDMTNLSFKHTSPVVVYKDVVITGGGGGEGPYPEAPGHIRGWDAKTGERRWIFHTVPKPGEFGHDTWAGDSWQYTGGTNNWGGMSVDLKRGLVFAGIGSPSFDYWGGNRLGDNLFGNCVLALDALTGKRKWHFQTVHHDTWDYDIPCPPSLVTIKQGRRTIEAVVQPTKQGFVFFFDRETGKPLFPVEERPVPPALFEGEVLSKTQPFPVKPPPVSRQGWKEEWTLDAARIEGFARGQLYEPVNTGNGVIVLPGFRGGALWGGCSFDPKLNLVFVNSDELPDLLGLTPAKPGMNVKYGLKTRSRLVDEKGRPGIKPPWGHLTAIDASKGDFRWRIVNGEYPDLKAQGVPKTGTPSFGGSIATGGGLVFMGGTLDEKFRAYESTTGKVVFEDQLPAGGFATPCSYEVNGKQFVAIAAGGGHGQKAGDKFVAYSL